MTKFLPSSNRTPKQALQLGPLTMRLLQSLARALHCSCPQVASRLPVCCAGASNGTGHQANGLLRRELEQCTNTMCKHQSRANTSHLPVPHPDLLLQAVIKMLRTQELCTCTSTVLTEALLPCVRWSHSLHACCRQPTVMQDAVHTFCPWTTVLTLLFKARVLRANVPVHGNGRTRDGNRSACCAVRMRTR
jgi:hypothetical protein